MTFTSKIKMLSNGVFRSAFLLPVDFFFSGVNGDKVNKWINKYASVFVGYYLGIHLVFIFFTFIYLFFRQIDLEKACRIFI